jgi:hypothetical protein
MSTPEGKVKAKIKKLLNKYGAYSHAPVQNGMGKPTLDFVCCVNGLYLTIEAKTRGKKPTTRQETTMGQVSKAGGLAVWVDEDRLESFETLLIKLSSLQVTFNESPTQP